MMLHILLLLVQGAVRSVAPHFPGVPESHFGGTPIQQFYIQLTLGFFIADSCFVRASNAECDGCAFT